MGTRKKIEALYKDKGDISYQELKLTGNRVAYTEALKSNSILPGLWFQETLTIIFLEDQFKNPIRSTVGNKTIRNWDQRECER